MSKIPCSHCGLEFEQTALIPDIIDSEELFFCCKGCQGVYHLLKDEGLDTFYDKRAHNTLEPPKDIFSDSGRFDLESFASKYITTKDGFSEISLIIEGIHCSACIWLNERIISRLDGVIEANINFTNNKAHIVWDANSLKLSTIIDKIRAIGYNAYPYDAKSQELVANKERRSSYLRLIVGVFASMNIMWIALALYSGYFGGIKESHQNILHLAEWMLATVTLFYSGSIFYKGAYYASRNKTVTMDTLVAVGSTLVYGYSLYAALNGKSEVYFDSVTMIITFVLAGKYLESLSKKQAVDVLDTIGANMPTEALLIRDGEKIILPLDSVGIGDIIEIKSGEHVAIDGIIIAGEADFDESSITGESIPVSKGIGDIVISGSVIVNSVVRYKSSKDYANSSFSVILKLLEESLAKKPNIENFANSLSRYFSVTILTLSALTFAIHFLILGKSFDSALIICVSVIVIACPCALALATPIASVVGVATAAKKRVIFKASSALEKLAKVSVLFVDKTGTLTEGRPQIYKSEKLADYDKGSLLFMLSGSHHPVARALLEHLGGHADEEIAGVIETKARGLEVTRDGKVLLGGNGSFLLEKNIEIPMYIASANFIFAQDGAICEAFWLKDKAREDSAMAIRKIRTLGVEVVMLTGDNEDNASQIASEVGIQNYHYSLKPDEKLEFVRNAQNDGNVVAMVGDGINDTAALALADVSVSLAGASDASVMSADIVLLNSNMTGLADSFLISKKTYGVIRQNILFSLIYNVITIPVAVMGFVIPPVAAASMSFSSIIVVLNSIRIKRG